MAQNWETAKQASLETPTSGAMPRVCEFYGVAIYVYYGEHGPPHFHARHAGREMSMAIDDLSILAGGLTPRATGMVAE